MNVLHMSILATILIVVIVLIRLLAINKLPRKTFMVLWGLVLFRLLIPVSIPLPFNVNPFFAVADKVMELITDTTSAQIAIPDTVIPDMPSMDYIKAWASEVTPEGATPIRPQVSPVTIIWIVGMIGFALFFLVTYFRCRREYQAAFPVKNEYVNKWLQTHKLCRSVKIRHTDRINAPMTYGIWKPVILFPMNTDWQDEARLSYVLTHELTHIKRFDILTKWLLAVAICVHWFNPLVWVMYILANRDIEFACDEKVVWTFGEATKSAYANTLIGLEERRSGFSPLCNNFAKNAIKERIEAIMKLKKKSIFGAILTVFMVSVLSIGVMAFEATAGDENGLGTNSLFRVQLQPFADECEAHNRLQSSELHFCAEESCCTDLIAAQANASTVDVDLKRIMEDIESGKIQLLTIESLLDRHPNGTLEKIVFANSYGVTTEVNLRSARDSVATLSACAHNWEVGRITIHTRNADGSCYTDVWNAVRCTRCGSIGVLDLVSVTFNRVCTH